MGLAVKYYADKYVGGIQGWYWPEDDVQTFPIISHDWETTHRTTIVRALNAAGKQFTNVVQAGGNCGMYPRLLSELFKAVYTFEPDPFNFYTMNLNCTRDNIVKMQAALGSHTGRVSMVHRTMQNVGMHQVVEQSTSNLPMVRLDDVLKLDSLDLLWLDIEDSELEALRGAGMTIRQHAPVIMCENATQQIKDVLNDRYNYEVYATSGMDTVFITPGVGPKL